MYQGLKESKYYWEFINVFRKVAIIAINVFVASNNPALKALIALIIIIIALRML